MCICGSNFGGGPAHGTLSMESDGSFTYTPYADYTGVDRFHFQGTRDGQQSNIATAVIQVGVSYTLPRLGWDNDYYDGYSTQIDTELSVGTTTGLMSLLDGGSGLSIVLPLADWMLPKHGTLSVNSDGSFTYTPNTGYVGVDCFLFQAVDEQNGIPGNALPVLIHVTAPSLGTYEGVHAQLASYNSVDLSWGDLTGGVCSYKVQYSTSLPFADPDYDSEHVFTVPAGTSRYVFSDLAEDTTYYFRVRANNGGPYPDWSAPQTVTTGSLATVWVEATQPNAPEDHVPATFTIFRSGDTSRALTVQSVGPELEGQQRRQGAVRGDPFGPSHASSRVVQFEPASNGSLAGAFDQPAANRQSFGQARAIPEAVPVLGQVAVQPVHRLHPGRVLGLCRLLFRLQFPQERGTFRFHQPVQVLLAPMLRLYAFAHSSLPQACMCSPT